MWWRSQDSHFHQPPQHPSIAAVSPPSTGVFPSQIAASIPFPEGTLELLCWDYAVIQRLGSNRTTQFQNPQNTVSAPLFTQMKN